MPSPSTRPSATSSPRSGVALAIGCGGLDFQGSRSVPRELGVTCVMAALDRGGRPRGRRPRPPGRRRPREGLALRRGRAGGRRAYRNLALGREILQRRGSG